MASSLQLCLVVLQERSFVTTHILSPTFPQGGVTVKADGGFRAAPAAGGLKSREFY